MVSFALNARTKGMGVRANGRTFGKSHGTILQACASPTPTNQLGHSPLPVRSH
ncbi:MAG: hypothetical protein F6K65_22930 [Moorea sp. SIO3C2]|nr:hypothetical protein [Moorena sp. SIO3C2]